MVKKLTSKQFVDWGKRYVKSRKELLEDFKDPYLRRIHPAETLEDMEEIAFGQRQGTAFKQHILHRKQAGLKKHRIGKSLKKMGR